MHERPYSGRRRIRLWTALLASVVLTAVTVGCSSDTDPEPDPIAASPTPAPTTPAVVEKPGGTLRMLTASMPSGDPGWADQPAERLLARLVTRQLYSYPAAADLTASTIPRPDLAAGAPVVTEGGTVYTVQLRSTGRWATPNQRRITATDVARGFKRMCAPPNPSPMRGYFAATIVGFAEYCEQLAATAPEDVPAAIESGSIEGVEVVGDSTIAFHLIAPVNDFVDLLALPAASPVPLESLAHPPDSPEYLENLISAGPYRFVSVSPGSYRLSRNPSWGASADGIRRALPDHITITDGVDAATALARIQAGEADLWMDGGLPAELAAGLVQAEGDQPAEGDQLVVSQTGSALALTVGLNGPAAAALREPEVRKALVYCVDRVAVAAALGGTVLAQPTAQLMQKPMTGYRPFDPYPTADGTGDPERCAAGLRDNPAGQVTALSLLTTDSPVDTAVAEALRTAFARADIRLDIRIRTGAQYQQAAVSPAGQFWDLALTTITPDWYGDAGRTVYQPLLDETWTTQRPADGGYRSPQALELLQKALTATTEETAAQEWAALEELVLTDAVVIPLVTLQAAHPRSAAVQSFPLVPSLRGADPAAVSVGR